MPTYDIPSFQDFVDGESSTVRGKLNDNFDNAEAQLQGVEDRLEESLTALHVDGVIWKRPGDVLDLIVSAGAGLSVNVSAGEALIGFKFQVSSFTNEAGNGITNGATNYCYLMQDGTLYFSDQWPVVSGQRNILLATVLAAGGAITAVDNYANGVVRGVGQPSLRAFQCSAECGVQSAVYISAANTVTQAESDDANPGKARVVGIVLAKESETSCIVATDGAIVGGYTGLSSGSAYYLQTVAGTLGTGKPTAPDPIVPVGIAVSTTAMLVKVFIDEATLDPGAAYPPHAGSHEVGGGDPLTNNLDANARGGVRRNGGASTYKRRRLNLVEGTGISIGLTDDPAEEEVEVSIASSGTAAHGVEHESGGSDELTLANLGGNLTNAQHGTLTGGDHSGDLTGNARVGVRKNTGGSTYKRRRVNLIEGTNIGITVADDAGSEEVDVTIEATGALGAHAADHRVGGIDEVYPAQTGSLVPDASFESEDSSLPLWTKATSGNGVTPTQDNTQRLSGSYSCKLSISSLSAGVDYSQIESQFIPITAIAPVRVRTYLISTNGTEWAKVFVDWYNASKVLISSDTVKDGIVTAAWLSNPTNLDPPALTAFFKIRIRQTDDGAAGDVFVDDVVVYRLGLAEVGVRKNSAGTIFQRRRLNLIEGNNVTLTVADDPTDEEVDVTIAATALPYIRNEIIVVVAGALTVGLKPGFMIAPAALTIEKIECQAETQPTGANGITVDIHKLTTALKDDNPTPAGTTIFPTQGHRPVIAAASNYISVTPSGDDVVAVAPGEVLRVWVDTVGGTIAGSDLTVCITVKQQAAWS